MIQLAGVPIEQSNLWPSGSIENLIYQRLSEDSIVYSYLSRDELVFEINLRKQIIVSATAMNQSSVQFQPFEYSRCNPSYWDLMNTGGFQLKAGVKPSDAIQDIYRNSSQYAFECATAIVIIYYHSVLSTLGEGIFNQLFQNMYLYSWHFDPDLGIQSVHTNHFLPGDVVYFNNPDFHLETPWWRGENAVVLGNGTYFGHGLGIMTPEQIIQHLNTSRNPGSMQSAYQTNLVTRPAFNELAKHSVLPRGYRSTKTPLAIVHHNESSIPSEQYLFYLKRLYIQLTYLNPFH